MADGSAAQSGAAEATVPGPHRATDDPDAPRQGPRLTYVPGLDGLRAFAVLSVMAYHGGISWMTGGFLGVDTFFVLSGFLITTLLIGEWRQRATIALGRFWARRARRLFPALLLMLLFVAAYAAWAVPAGTYPGLRLDAMSTLFYVANWHFILVGTNYWNAHSAPSPLTHTWTLAIEEQFYLVWPLVVLAVLRLSKSVTMLLWVCIGGALASALLMAGLFHAGSDLTRLYYGTDTHAQCLLVGAALASGLAVVAERRRRAGRVPPPAEWGGQEPGGDPAWVATGRTRSVLAVAGVVGAVGMVALWVTATGQDTVLYNGGFLLAALLSAAVLASLVCVQQGWLAWLLSFSPVRYLGRISYGMYLWHYPLFLFLDNERTGLLGPWLFLLRCVVTVAVASASFYLVERPIRQGTFFRDWRAWVAAPVGVLLVVLALVGATVTPAVALVGPGSGAQPGNDPALYRGPPVRILLVGDSTMLTLGLGLGLQEVQKKYNVDELDEGILGCGVAEGGPIREEGQVIEPSAACEPSTPSAQQWPADWQGWIHEFHPNVVALLAGRWEVADWHFDGRWTNILDPVFAAFVTRQLQKAVDVATSGGARVVLLTAPCYDSGEQPNGEPWPDDSLARVTAYNALVRHVAAVNPGKVSLVDLFHLACPGGHYALDIDGVQVRSPDDGVHFSVAGGAYLAPFLLPTMVEAGRQQILDGH